MDEIAGSKIKLSSDKCPLTFLYVRQYGQSAIHIPSLEVKTNYQPLLVTPTFLAFYTVQFNWVQMMYHSKQLYASCSYRLLVSHVLAHYLVHLLWIRMSSADLLLYDTTVNAISWPCGTSEVKTNYQPLLCLAVMIIEESWGISGKTAPSYEFI